MSDRTVLALVGSLREASTNRKLAEAAQQLAPEGSRVEIFEGLGELPFYNEDIDQPGSAPEVAGKLREAVAAADAVIFFTPEYNGTITAVLKNAIDWLSRPYADGAVKNKPVAVIGTSLGQYGGVWAHDEARKALQIAGGTVVEDVKLSIPSSLSRFAEAHPREDAEVTEKLTEALNKLLSA
ncbi:NAD(P)H-dependent oxidoreductase [Acaricomes phytoseiuli]|uniref:NAD(P)H-dependent oxidoreductase n=1 Tax=Acaricomes phytoseiuli TaxID=291968 RepID=UPI000361D114|nr:NADPH-dependent FMN reductase [Acaricomes phytoseiuli]MCW1250542.1 NAD(P)H-dependent oxidoreductase [Acaricomes phytoseiuli]